MCINNPSSTDTAVALLIESTPQPKNDSSAEAVPLPVIVTTSIKNQQPSFDQTGQYQLILTVLNFPR